jgi:hypothetical protein
MDEIKVLTEIVQNPGLDNDGYGMRSRLAERIRDVVADLRLGPAGTKPILKQQITRIRISSLERPTKELLLKGLNAMENERFFTVKFKNGASKQANLKRDDPLAYISITDID